MPTVQSPEHAAFGEAVRELRTKRHLSQEELAFRAGLHRNYVGACERGEINLSLRVMLQLAAGLGVSFLELAQAYDRIDATKAGAVAPGSGGQRVAVESTARSASQ